MFHIEKCQNYNKIFKQNLLKTKQLLKFKGFSQ